MIVIDIAQIQLLTEFNARMDQLIADLKAVPLAQGFDEVFYPGEIEARNAARNHAEGLALPEDTRADLHRLAEETGITPGW